MNATNKALCVIAFYLSEYDMDAVRKLGFKTRTEALNTLSSTIGKGNNYLKFRRDEFDALPDSSSPRRGWNNRPPLKEVVETAAYLHEFSFEDLSAIVQSIINNHLQGEITDNENFTNVVLPQLSEEAIEQIVNSKDPTARLEINTCGGKHRIYNKSVVLGLKKLYKGCCQVCGLNPVESFNTTICEAHHIDFFAESHNNDAGNIIIVCPNHHRLIHDLRPEFDFERLVFHKNGEVLLPVRIDFHLKR